MIVRLVRRCMILATMSVYSLVASDGFAAQRDSVTTPALYPEQIAQKKIVESTQIIMPGNSKVNADSDSIRRLISQFYINQFRHSQDPQVPYFMFMSKSGNLTLGVGGTVRMRGWFDWNGSIPANGFSPFAIEIPKNPTNMRRLGATPAGTGLFMTLIGNNPVLGSFLGYIEGNFDGYNHVGFKLKKAYVTIRDWTVGYATSTFSDPAAEPPVIDGAGANGKISKTNVLVRYLHTFRNGISVAGSFEFPKSQTDADAVNTAACSDYVPDIAAFAQYQWNQGLSHVRLSGLLRFMNYRDLLENCNHHVAGWGVQASSVVKIYNPFSLFGIVAYGQGHESYIGDLSGGNFDLVGDSFTPGKMYAPKALSLTAGAKFYFMNNLYASATAAMLRYYPKKGVEGTIYKYGMYGALSMFWDITPRLQVGAEYLAGKKKTFNGEHGNANRIDALFMLSF